jgi:hypothetical protein
MSVCTCLFLLLARVQVLYVLLLHCSVAWNKWWVLAGMCPALHLFTQGCHCAQGNHSCLFVCGCFPRSSWWFTEQWDRSALQHAAACLMESGATFCCYPGCTIKCIM